MSNLRSGQIWCKKIDISHNATWRIVSCKPDVIALSGPGPCRSLTSVTPKQLEAEWHQPPIYGALFLLQEQLQSFDAFRHIGVGADDAGSEELHLYQKINKSFPKGKVPESVEFEGKSFKVVVHKTGEIRPSS